MTSMKNYFLILHWIMVAVLFFVSVLWDRAVGMIGFSVALSWEAYTHWILPIRLRRHTVGPRLNNQRLRQSMQESPLGVDRLLTELRILSPEWPTPLLLQDGKQRILIPKILINKLDTEEQILFMYWCHLSFEAQLPQFGMKFYSYSRPFLWIASIIDKGLQTLRPISFSLESTVYSLLLRIFYPVVHQHKNVMRDLVSQFSSEEVSRLQRKLHSLGAARGHFLPSAQGLLTLDIQNVAAFAPLKNRNHTTTTLLKGSLPWKISRNLKPTSPRSFYP